MSILVWFAAVAIHSHASCIDVFNGVNFSEWHEQVDFHIGVMGLDLALLEDKLTAIIDSRSEEERLYFKGWKWSNMIECKVLANDKCQ